MIEVFERKRILKGEPARLRETLLLVVFATGEKVLALGGQGTTYEKAGENRKGHL